MKSYLLFFLFLCWGTTLFAEDSFRYRYWMIPAEKINEAPWGEEKYYPVRLERFRQWIDALRSVSTEGESLLQEARLEATLVNNALSEGVGSFRFVAEGSDTRQISPCSIALSDFRWEDGSEALVGTNGIHPITVANVDPNRALLFSWSLSPESDENGRQIYRFDLPRSPAVSLRLHLPEGLIPTLDRGLVTQNVEDGSWTIEPGPGGKFSLTLTEKDQPQQVSVPQSVSEQILCNVALEGVELTYTARFTRTAELPNSFTLMLDEPFLPEKIEWKSEGIADAVWEKEGRSQKIVVFSPKFDPEETPQLTLTAFAPLKTGDTLRMPPVRCPEIPWQETRLGVTFVPPTAPENYIFVDAGQSGPAGLFRLYKRTGSVKIPLTCLNEKIAFESASRVTEESGEIRFETDLLLKTDLPGTRRVSIPIKPEWNPESASAAGVPIPFRHELDDDSAQITLALEQPIPTDRPLRVRITGRRNTVGTSALLSDYAPLEIEEPAAGTHLIALSAEPTSKITLTDSEERPWSASIVSEETVRRLFDTIPDGTIFSLDQSAPDLRVRFDKTVPTYAADLLGRVELYAEKIHEVWDIHCIPPAGSRIDRIPVTFTTNDTEPWRIVLTPMESDKISLAMRPATSTEIEEFRLPDNQNLGEITLPTPRSAPFTVRLERERKERLSAGPKIPLLSLCNTPNQTGRIDIFTPDFIPARLEAEGPVPVTPPLPENGKAASALASYRYDPAQRAELRLSAKETKESRRTGWCRFLRLENDYASCGKVRTRAICNIENTGIPSMQVRFPGSLVLIKAGGARLGKESIPSTFNKEERTLDIPLPTDRGNMTISFEYESAIRPFRFMTYISKELPRLSLPVLEGCWIARIPMEYHLDKQEPPVFPFRNTEEPVHVPLASPTGGYLLISTYCLYILQIFVFFATTAFCLQREPVHTFIFALPILLLALLTNSAMIASVLLGIFCGCLSTSIFTFFYRRPLREVAGDRSGITRNLSKTTLLFLFVTAASFLRADETYSVFVPSHEQEAASDEPAWIPEDLHNRLTEWERENALPEHVAQLRSALYEGQLNYNRDTGRYTLFRLTAKYDIVTTEPDSRLKLPAMPIFQHGGILVDGVAGGVSLSHGEDRMNLELRGALPGNHSLEIPLVPDPFDEKNPEGLTIALPVVPNAKLLLRMAADVPVPRLVGAMGQVSHSSGILTADLGQTSSITFLPPEKTAPRSDASIDVDQEFRLVFEENQIVLHGEFLLRIGGKCDAITFLADPRYKLLRCTSSEADLIPAPLTEETDRISIALRQPVTGTVTLRADFAPRNFGGVGALPLPIIRIAEASIASNRLRMPAGYYPSEYDLTDPDTLQKSVPLAPSAPEPKMTESASYRFSVRDTAVTYLAEVKTGGSLWQISLRIPECSLIESIEVIDSSEEQVTFQKGEEASLVHLFFDEALHGIYRIRLTLRTTAGETFPLVGILDIPAENAEIDFECAEDLYSQFTSPEDWTSLPAAQGRKRWGLPAAAASLVPPSIEIKPNRPQAEYSSYIFFYPLFGDANRTWELRADCNFRITGGQLERLEFEVDESFRPDTIRIEPATFKVGIERTAEGDRRLILTAAEPLRGNSRLIVRAPIQRGTVRLPKFDYVSSAEQKEQVWLPTREGETPIVWQTENLQICPPETFREPLEPGSRILPFTPNSYFPHEVAKVSHLPFDAFQSYRPTGSGPFTASILAERTALRLEGSEIEYFLCSDGSYWGKAVYDLRLGSESQCEIKVPVNQQLLLATADGVPLAPIPQEKSNLLRLRFIPDIPFTRLTLTFKREKETPQNVRAGQRLYSVCRLKAPAPAGVNPSAGFWTIHLQKEARRLPYYVCQDTTHTLPLKAIRAGFPGTRDTQPLPESGPWKYPIPADKALPLQARLNVEKLGHLLDIFEASDQQAPPFDGGSVDWIENHVLIYNRTCEFYNNPSFPAMDRQHRNAFYRATSDASQTPLPPLTSGKEEFDALVERWEAISRQWTPTDKKDKEQTTTPKSSKVTSFPSDIGTSRENDSESNFLLFGTVDPLTDILLLIPTEQMKSLAPLRITLEILAVLFAAAVCWGGWRAGRRQASGVATSSSEETHRGEEEEEDEEPGEVRVDEKTAPQSEDTDGKEPEQKPEETGNEESKETVEAPAVPQQEGSSTKPL
ncbi:MAG: hypothetical protein ACOX6D_06795 [Thermoguttaceae bacterium]|jgi:hypothetical protein